MSTRRIRWKPLFWILALTIVALIVIEALDTFQYEQARIHARIAALSVGGILLGIWWFFLSGLPGAIRLLGLVVCLVPFGLFRIRGMSGDFIPIIEFRFGKKTIQSSSRPLVDGGSARPDYPQLFGPNRDARLSGVELQTDWNAHPPQWVWRQPIGAGWGGFVIVGNRAVTQEQDGETECVTCYEATTGKLLWKTTNPGRYDTKIAGIGPRATPTISGGKVYTLGALGWVQCLDLESGTRVWGRDMAADGKARVPEWGFSSSPLIHDGKVIVSAGGEVGSLFAYSVQDGAIVWQAGKRPVGYSSPFLYQLSGRPQVVMFNSQAITAHDPATGAVLWERDWGRGMPHVARPIPVGENRMFFSSGYGVGSALIEFKPAADGKFSTDEVWRTSRFQAKFSNPAEREGHVYGVSDGIFACLNLENGTVTWKDGRYGHGQGLMLGAQYLQMTEMPGKLVLLEPTPTGANEKGQFPVFDDKTWNPIALSGDLLFVRNDQEAGCIRLPVKPAK